MVNADTFFLHFICVPVSGTAHISLDSFDSSRICRNMWETKNSEHKNSKSVPGLLDNDASSMFI